MKNFLLLSGLFFTVLFLLPIESQAQWGPDVRLTNSLGWSTLARNNAHPIATNGNNIYVVWQELLYDTIFVVFFKQSTDAGNSWGPDIRISNNTGWDWANSPSVAVSGLNVHVVWYLHHDGYSNAEIYYKHSTDGGLNWGLMETKLTDVDGISRDPVVTVSGSVVHVVWWDDRYGGYNEEIYYKRSINEGVTWENEVRLTNDSHHSSWPSLAVSNSIVHVVWYDDRNGLSDIFYKRSADGGTSWSSDILLTIDPEDSFASSITVSDSVVNVVWVDRRDGNSEIYYKSSADAGLTWGADTRLTNNQAVSTFPSIAISDSIVHIVWQEERDGNKEIYYKRSTDGGSNWETDIRLTTNSATSFLPTVAISGYVVNVVWSDNRDGNQEIYYKRNPTGNVTNIENSNTELLKEFILYQNFPNPFNPSTKISWQSPVSSWQTIKVFNSLGQEVETVVDEYLAAGVHSKLYIVNSTLPSGIYFYQLKAGNYLETKKMVLVK